MFDPNRSLWAGMDTATLQNLLNQAQLARAALMSGQQTASISLASGEVTRTLVYRATNIGALAAMIQELQAQLGIVHNPRRELWVQ